MERTNPAEVAICFIESINHRDFDGLAALMSDNHRAIDEKGEVNQGREVAKGVIEDYTKQFPDFLIHINEVYRQEGTVIIMGRSTGSCAGTPRDIEIKERLLYVFKVKEGLVTEFQYAIADTAEKRAELGVDAFTCITV